MSCSWGKSLVSLITYFLCNRFCIGIVKDYFLVGAAGGEKPTMYWCSSSTWVFSQLPSCPSDPKDIKKLCSVNNFFTGEFDTVLFAGSGAPKVIDAELGVVLHPKSLTELDRLSCVF